MSSERIKHDGSARCPVEDDAVVFVIYDSGRVCHTNLLAHGVDWQCVAEYEIIRGWSRPLADIFAELPDDAEWIVADCNSSRAYSIEPEWYSRHSLWRAFYPAQGWHGAVNATYYGDWRGSKRKRPEAKRTRAFDLAREATTGQLDSLKETIKRGGVEAVLNDYGHKVQQSELEKDLQERFAEKPAPWFVCDGSVVMGEFTEEETASAMSMAEQNAVGTGRTIYLCRAVASFTAKVERTTYESGGE